MKGLFESLKKRKYIDQMYMAERKETSKYYYIIGKFSALSKIDRNMIANIQMLDCRNYGQSFN